MKILSQYRGLRRELYVLFFCELIDNAGSLIGPMLTLILSAKLGMDAGQIALYFLVYTALSLPIHLIGGRLTDKVNKKLLINVCDITTSVIYIICGIVGFGRVTLAFYLFGSLLQSVESPAYKSLVADFTTAADRERAYSLNYLGMNLGMVLAPTLGGFLIKNHLGLMFILSGVFELLSILLFDLFIKDTGAIRDTGNAYEDRVEGKSVLRVLREGRVMFPYIIAFSFSMLVYNMYGYLMPLSMAAAHGDDLGSILFGTLSSVNCAVVLIFTALLTAAFARFVTLDKIIAGNLFELVGLALFFLFIGTPAVYYVAITLFTFGEILNTTTTTPHLTKRIPANYRGRVIALSAVASNLVTSLGKYVIGKIYDVASETAAWITVLCIGAAATLGYLAIRRADRRVFPDLYEQKSAI